MKLTRTITALLLAGILLPTFVACGGTTVTVGTTAGDTTERTPDSAITVTDAPVTTAPPVTTAGVPDRQYPSVQPCNDVNFAKEGCKGEELIVNVAYVEGTVGEYVRRSLKADAFADDSVDLQTLERDQRLKAQMGLELKITEIPSIDGMESALGTALMAGTSEFDLLAGYQYFALRMATWGALVNLANIDRYDANYIDFAADYWATEYNDAINSQGVYCWITGDLALNYLGGMYCTFVNAALYSEYMEDYYGSIYMIARNGKWTIDLLNEMSLQCYADIGSVSGKPDSEDIYGFGYEKNDMIDALALGMGVQYTRPVPDTGEIVLAIMSDRNYDISDKIRLTSERATSYGYADGDGANVMQAFADGSLLFTVNQLCYAEQYLMEMEEFWIVPMPKYDKNQTNYITPVHEGCTVFGITCCTSKVRQTAAALEFLCAYSSRDVKPKYYDQLLKRRYTLDVDIAEMIDLIHGSATTDFGYAWSRSLGDIGYIYRDCASIDSSHIKRKAIDWEEALTELNEDFDHLRNYPELE